MNEDDETPYPSDGEEPEPRNADPNVTNTDDGGAIVSMEGDDEPTADEDAFYANLAEKIPQTELNKLAIELLERIEYDRDSRKDRDEKYAEGIKRTGLGDEAPGGAAFVGGSIATHPMMSKSTVYYQSHTIGELMPPAGPVRDFIPGTPTPARVEKAKRKTAHMNWQFRKQMPEFRSELEKLLSQQTLAGSQYMRLVYDSAKKRPTPSFWPIDKVLIPEAAADFYSAERRTLEDQITQHEFEQRIRQGYYVPAPVVSPSQSPDRSKAERATDKVQGKDTPTMNEDGLRRIYIVELLAEVEDTDNLRVAGGGRRSSDPNQLKEGDGPGPRPYLLELDEQNRQIVRIVRNWEEDDEQHENMCWVVDFPFIPWRGAQSVGMIHLIGSLAGGATGALRSLLDNALIQNIPTLVKLKGTNSPGQTLDLNICQVTEIEGNLAGDQDIRKVLMAMPFNPPSTMLYQLLEFLTQQGDEVIKTTFENLSEDGSANMPVGTTLALIEQGMKVLAAIHMRLHMAMDRLIGVLHRINRLYITDEEILDDTGEMLAYRADYEGPVDVLPVSDPQVFSDIQRFAQLQIIAQRSQLLPQLYDLRKVEELILERTKVPNAVDLLLPQPKVEELNAVNENVAMTLGRPVQALPEQEHLAHIQVLLDYMMSPYFGMLSIIAPKYLPAALVHLSEHLTYWYMSHTVDLCKQAGANVDEYVKIQDPEIKVEMDKTLATASTNVMKQAQQTFASIPAIVQRAQQFLQSLMPPPPQDPSQTAVQVAQIQNQPKMEALKQKASEVQQATQKDQANSQTEMQQTAMQEQGDNERTAAELQVKEKINQEDNATALEIAAAKIETGHGTNLSTGTGISHDINP